MIQHSWLDTIEVEETRGVTVIPMMFFLNGEGKFVENLSVFMK